MNAIILRSGRDKAAKHRHPWIFSGAIQEVIGNPTNGETIEVVDSKKEFLGMAAYSPFSQIRARFWTFKKEPINIDFFKKRFLFAIQKRKDFQKYSTDTAWRMIHGESDMIPGLIVDRYNDILVLQILSSGVEFHRDIIISALRDVTGIDNIYERSDVDVRRLEGLEERNTLVSGVVPEEINIIEGDLKFIVKVTTGQKTGFYLDQRENRKISSKYFMDKDVLNVFSFTGGFSVYAVHHKAKSVISIDSSKSATEIAKKNLEINGLDGANCEWLVDDAFKALRTMRDQDRKFDVVVLDPPKFAATQAQVERASRGYKDINLLGFKLLNPGGTLITFSCSGGISESLFQKIVADAALDAGVTSSIVEKLNQGPDHPIGLNFPEGAYLKGLICKID
ncbi:MAG: class I SAM-dependent rRNA methyltransferase [Anaerolineaceae bacterium]